MRTLAAILAAVALTLAACGGDDDGTPGDGDAGIDSPPGAIDAAVDAPMGTSALGRPCMGNGQGNCPTGWLCIQLSAQRGRWCSKRCTSTADMSCEDGYTGPGAPLCLFSVDFMDGNPPVNMCAVACEDASGGPLLCPDGASQCNGMCPGTLQCTRNITPQGMPTNVLGKACF
jgi:hypothetical protein